MAPLAEAPSGSSVLPPGLADMMTPELLSNTAIVLLGLSLIAYFLKSALPEVEVEKPKEVVAVVEAEIVPPPDGVFTAESLALWTGAERKIFMGVAGKVYDVTLSENIRPGEGYGKLWAGKDATYALAKMSLKFEDVNTFDFKPPDLSKNERKSLASWARHFEKAYPKVGTLHELQGLDLKPAYVELDASEKELDPGGLRKRA